MATNFSFEGLLGGINNAFGGGSSNYLDEYLTPDQKRMMQRNAMLAASAALLKAGGESTRRIGIGEALGEALQAGQGGYEKAQTGALTQMSLKQKLDEAKRAKELNARLAGIMGTSGEMESPQTTANQLMQAGRAAFQAGDFTRAFDFYRQAREVNPKDEVQGAPFEGTDAQGNPIMLQQMKGGAIRPISGYGVKQGAIGQPFEVTGPNGKPMLVQQLPNGTLREVSGVSAKQAAPGQPIEMTDAQGQSVMVQQMPDGSFRPVAGFTPKQAAPSQPFEVAGPGGQPMLVQQLSDGTLRQVTGATPKQAAPSQPFEVSGPDGNPMLVQQMPDGSLRQVIGASPKQAAPSQPFEVSGPNGQPMLVQQLSDGTLRQVTGASPKQAAPGEPFEVTGADGKPVLVQKMSDGSLRPVSGFAPKQEAAVAPVEVTGADGKPMLVTPQRGGGYTPVIGIGPKQEASTNEEKQLKSMGLKFTMANLAALRRAGAAPAADKAPRTQQVQLEDGTIGLINMDTGAVTRSTVGGVEVKGKSEAPVAFSEASRKLNNLKGNISAYKTEINSNKTVFPSEVPLPFGARIPLPTGEDTARLRGKYQSLLMGVKDLYELGALTGPDMGIIEQQLTNPASFAGMFTSRDAMREQIKVLEDMAGRAEENLSVTYKRKIPAASTSGIPAEPGARPADIEKIINQYRRTR